MEKVVLYGAGQMGTMILRLIGTDYKVCCFADSRESTWDTCILGTEVLSPEKSLSFGPDKYIICVLDDKRSEEIEKRIRSIGFEGEIVRSSSLKLFDSRVAVMRLLSEQIYKHNIPGDVAELGVFKGEFASIINAAFPDREICLFDTFEGFDERDVVAEKNLNLSRAKTGDFSETSLESVLNSLPYKDKAVVFKGYFPDTFTCDERTFAFVSVDADLYKPTAAALPIFYSHLSPGGAILVHDVISKQFEGPMRAVDEFCISENILYDPVSDLHGSIIIRKPLAR